MQEIIVHIPYFGSIFQYARVLQADKVWLEYEDNYQKQTHRNRMYIYGANGRLLLNIPIKHKKTGETNHQKYKEVKIETDFSWQKQHWKSLKSAYQTSPFFEFYEDELAPLYHNSFTYLMDFNLKCLEFLKDHVESEFETELTSEFLSKPPQKDLRHLINAKTIVEIPSYTQVFQEKHGFIPNLCILDLLFNEGPSTCQYLKTIS